MKKLSLAYFGTPDFSARFLENLLKDKNLPVEVKVVVTQPDKKVGRKQVLTPSPVKVTAEKHGLPVISNVVRDLKEEISRSTRNDKGSVRNALKNVDLALLFAYGEILPKELLTVPKHGFWNIHPSLLPKYRGASPVAFPLMNGDKETGVTLIQMDEKMDHGPVIVQEVVEILPKEKKNELTIRLADAGFELFKKVISNGVRNLQISQSHSLLRDDELKSQNEADATYTRLLTKQDGFIEFETLKTKKNSSSEEIFNKFRGLYPWPGLWTEVEIDGAKKRLKITDMDLVNGQLIFLRVQLEGKKETTFKQFNEVHRLF